MTIAGYVHTSARGLDSWVHDKPRLTASVPNASFRLTCLREPVACGTR